MMRSDQISGSSNAFDMRKLEQEIYAIQKGPRQPISDSYALVPAEVSLKYTDSNKKRLIIYRKKIWRILSISSGV